MSLFKPDRWFMSLERDRLALVRCRGIFGTRIEAEYLVEARLDVEEPANALGRLASEVQGTLARAPLHVVLSDQLVRAFVFERVAGLASLAELRNAVAARFEEIFGLPPGEWDIRADYRPITARILACAIRHDLLAALEQMCTDLGLHLASVRPFLVSEFNRCHRRFGKSPAWLAVAERGGLSLALLSPKGWSLVRTHSFAAGYPADLPLLVRREALMSGIPAASAPVYLTGLGDSGEDNGKGPSAIIALGSPAWPERSPEWSRNYRLALSGIWP